MNATVEEAVAVERDAVRHAAETVSTMQAQVTELETELPTDGWLRRTIQRRLKEVEDGLVGALAARTQAADALTTARTEARAKILDDAQPARHKLIATLTGKIGALEKAAAAVETFDADLASRLGGTTQPRAFPNIRRNCAAWRDVLHREG